MEQNVQEKEGISLLDILRLLWSKVLILLLTVIVGGLAGAGVAIVRTINVDYWGTRVEFYVNPDKPKQTTGEGSQYGVYGAYGRHVMDNMVKLLDSESFTEQLMLNGADLPNAAYWVNEDNEAEVALGLDKLVEDAKIAMKAAKDEQTVANVASEAAAEDLEALQSIWSEMIVYSKNHSYATTYSKSVYTSVLHELEQLGTVNTATLESAYAKYEGKEGSKAMAEAAQKKANEAQEVAEEAQAAALGAWSNTAAYKKELAKYSAAVSFSYLRADEDAEDANNLARSFIYVNISVLNDREFASELLESVKSVVPGYVEENMAKPADYEGTNCQRITRSDEIRLTNPGYTTTEAIKYGLLFAAAALVIACVIIIIVDRSDKRLRDYEIITKQFNVPVLGVVPTIETLTEESNAKAKQNAKKNKEAK